MERHARILCLVDLPNARSSHVTPRPRGGGIGILAGVAAGTIAAELLALPLDPRLWTLFASALLVALLGFWDDVRGLPAWPRLLTQFAAATAVVLAYGGFERLPLPAPLDLQIGAAGGVLAVIWIVGVTNFFNFMDGADGLAGGQAGLTLVLLAWALWPSDGAGFALLTAGATFAFLTRNWSPARIFLGDVGSSFLGFLLAALPLMGPAGTSPDLVLMVALSLALFLLDPTVTLIVRCRRGAPFGAAHREHAYQQFFAPDRSHARAVSGLLLAGVALTALAAVGHRHPSFCWLAIALAVVIFAGEWRLAARRRVADRATPHDH